MDKANAVEKVLEAGKKTSTILNVAGGVAVGVGVVAAISAGLYYLIGFCTRCRHCNAWWSVVEVRRTLLNTESKSRDVDREDEHFDAQGKKTGSTHRQERVYIIEKTFDVEMNCTKCSETWTERKVVNS